MMTEGTDTVLVVGSGGREHTLAWKLAQSPIVKKVLVAPGNAGTQSSNKMSNVDVDVGDFEKLALWCKENKVNTVVVGPEAPLAAGITDTLSKHGVPCFGPSAAAAEIEASKSFAKSFMSKHEIPTARWKAFKKMEDAHNFINNADFPALVVKASGLAAGKGVIVAENKQEACEAVTKMLNDGMFGSAGDEVIVEELLTGQEISVLAFTDGTSVECFPPAQDHKRAEEGNQGPNTGGMGAYCPCPLVTEYQLEEIKEKVIQKAVDGLKKEDRTYVGVLYAGLILTDDGPKVLEFNCRFGDPEAQVILPLLKTDIYVLIQKCLKQKLDTIKIEMMENQHAVAIVTVSNGYPGSYKKGHEIKGLEQAVGPDCLVFHAGTKLDGDKVVTNGGRVLATVGQGEDLEVALKNALKGAEVIEYTGKQYRRDIGLSAINRSSLSYADSGVDIAAGESLVDGIKPVAASTARTGCRAELGGFGGFFDLKAAGYKDPLLVSGTDGVGTKLKVAQACGVHDTVGIDLVAMCVNDILCHGAEPLYFLDYFACGKLDVSVAQRVVEGVGQGCKLAGCALLGGETAEMPGMYVSEEYDLGGFAVGAVERDRALPKLDEVCTGDVLLGLPSSGLHSNGLSLVRRVVEHCGFTYDMTCPFNTSTTLGESLLTPTKIYVSSVLPVLWLGKVKALAHITGGGLPGNVCRVLPDSLAARLDAKKWPMLPVFRWIYKKGNVAPEEMATTFNCGLGLVLIVSSDESQYVTEQLVKAGEHPVVVGEVVTKRPGGESVEIDNLKESLEEGRTTTGKHRAEEAGAEGKRSRTNGVVVEQKRVAVLISGSGTNLQSLINHTQSCHSPATISLVISNKPGVQGLQRAEAANIPTKVVDHKLYKSREEFERVIHEALCEADIDIVCLAGFMRVLTGWFVSRWRGRLLNIHPSLLPSFPGANAHRLAIAAHVRISGCTVHFVAEEVDGGAFLVQESVPVHPGDTEETLSERVKTVEHKAYPQALDMVASGRAVLGPDGAIQWN